MMITLICSTARGRPNTASEEITVAKLVDIPDTADIKYDYKYIHLH